MNKINLLFIKVLILVGTVNTALAAEDILRLKVTTWNVEWLSCNQYGPSDDELQMSNVAEVIRLLDSDLVALQEVGTSDAYPTIDILVRKLGSEWGGKIVYSKNTNCGQNQGIIFKKSTMKLVNSSLMNSGKESQGNSYYYNWSSGRYPAQYTMNIVAGDNSIPVSFINIHSKAMRDISSYVRRVGASDALKTILDSPDYNSKNIILLGDFNDYLQGTQCRDCTGSPYYSQSPYKNFMDDSENYKGLTAHLDDPYYRNPVIDNIVISDELFDMYESSSAIREVSVTQRIPNYWSTTSDHTPISAVFNIPYDSSTVPDKPEFVIKTYPNPSNGKFTVTYGQYKVGDQVDIYTLTGVLIDTYQAKSSTVEIDLTHAQNGCYILKIRNKAVKIIKN